MKIEERAKLIVEEQLHVKIRTDGEKLFDMGADSFDLIEIANELEDKFEIKIENEELSNELTVRDVVRMVRRKVEKTNETQTT